MMFLQLDRASKSLPTFDHSRHPRGQPAQETGPEGLDKLDRKLLVVLQDNDRLGLAELGKSVGSPPSTVNDRIKRLVRNGSPPMLLASNC